MSNTMHLLSISTLTFILTLVGCGGEEQSKPLPTTEQDSSNTNQQHTAGHGGTVIQLGSISIGSFNIMATRDEGNIVAGKDAPIDVTVTPVADSTVTAIAVRFWIGTKYAMGSVKAKADIENPAEPNRWHTHADVPNPIPSGSQLWVEIETDKRDRVTGSFDLRTQQQ
jgi:hypothetical protein